MSYRTLLVAVAISLWGYMPTGLADVPVRIAKLAFRPAADVEARWQPLADYLNQQSPGYRFQFEAYGYKDLERVIARREVDFVFTNPGHYILMTYRNGLSSPLATLVPLENGKTLSKFGGVIITRADQHKIKSIEQMRGHSVAAVTQGSHGGYQTQAMELAMAGIRIPQDVQLIETGMPHDRVVTAVLEGKVDAGFVRTGILEHMAQEGKLDLADIRVVSPRRESGFPLLLSTRLYPEWPFAAMPNVDDDLARQVTAALLSIPHGEGIAQELGIHGFTIPTDYEAVRSALKELRLPPFDETPDFTLEDIWNKYRAQLLVGLALVTLVVALSLWLIFLNQRLAVERRRQQRNASEWHHLLTALGEGVYGVDEIGNCTFVNPSALTMLGYSESEVIGHDLHALFHHHHEDGTEYPESECPISLTLKDGIGRNWQDWFWRKDGSGVPVTLTTAPMGERGKPAGAVVVFRDITTQRNIENRLRKEASTDPLTGVPNRRLFLDQLSKEFSRFKRFGGPTTMIMIDLDHFKQVNDRYGHATGDEVLCHFTDLAIETHRGGDMLGRLGGEEFAIVLPSTDIENARRYAERLRLSVEKRPAMTSQGEIPITISLGITEFDQGDHAPDKIIKRADQALYQAKENGRNRVEVCISNTPVPHKTFVHLQWENGYKSGEPTIDKVHHELFDLANRLLDQSIKPNVAPADMKDSFQLLMTHVKDHFEQEEKVLREYGYAPVEEHAELHQKLLDEAGLLYRQIEEGKTQIRDIVNFLVVDVVADHMLKEDLKYHGLFNR